MRDHDDIPTIIIERDSGGGFGAFVFGALVGAGVALLLAPQSGEETQAELKRRAEELKGSAEDRLKAASDQLESRLDEARGTSSSTSSRRRRRPIGPGSMPRRRR